MKQEIFNPITQMKKKEEETKGDISPENTFYDIAPVLTLEEKKADVSYNYDKVYNKREADIYRDQNGNAWFEINKSPRKQMMISLLSQPFFNISTIIEVPKKENKVTTFFSKTNPKLGSIFNSVSKLFYNSSPTFLSKGLDLDKVESGRSKMISDYIVFESIFDNGAGDRSFTERHNINRQGSAYALFDFSDSGIIPFKHFVQSKAPGGYFNKPPNDGMTDYFENIRFMLTEGNTNYNSEVKIPLAIISDTVGKLKQIKEFFQGEEGEKFVKAVLDKTKYEEEYKQQHSQVSKKEVLDESYFNPGELAKGVLAQVSYSSAVLLEELKRTKDSYIQKQENKEEALKQYESFILKLEEIIK